MYGLLSLNVVLFLVGQTLVEAVDSLAWLLLLLLLEWETRRLRDGAVGPRHCKRRQLLPAVARGHVEHLDRVHRPRGIRATCDDNLARAQHLHRRLKSSDQGASQA